ncbi:hypothetical protein BC941DRAFT_418826, partial [Chlamydoabsidia padenii]
MVTWMIVAGSVILLLPHMLDWVMINKLIQTGNSLQHYGLDCTMNKVMTVSGFISLPFFTHI